MLISGFTHPASFDSDKQPIVFGCPGPGDLVNDVRRRVRVMLVLQDDIRSERRSGLAAPNVHDAQRDRVDFTAWCSCTVTSIPSLAGEVLVLRVDGEVDLLTVAVLQGALTDGLARGPCHLLVDLAELTFCSVRGLALLVEAGGTAAGQGTGYAVSAASRQVNRVWTLLCLDSEVPAQYPTATAGVAAALAGLGAPARDA
jgi:anti-sigma B factor antagonist